MIPLIMMILTVSSFFASLALAVAILFAVVSPVVDLRPMFALTLLSCACDIVTSILLLAHYH